VRTLAVVVCVLSLFGIANAGQLGEITAGQQIPAGEFAYVVPPTAHVGSKLVVVASAPRVRWLVNGGYSSYRNCEQSRTGAIAYRNQVMQAQIDSARTDTNSPAWRRFAELQKQGLSPKAAADQAVDEYTQESFVGILQAMHAKCEKSDGSALFRIQPRLVAAPDDDASVRDHTR
jgi:hypothetical protein